MKKGVWIVIGLILLGAAALWRYELAPRWAQRIPPGWHWEANFVGIEAYPDEATGKFPEKSLASRYERSMRIVDEGNRPDAVSMEDRYTIRNSATGKTVWEYIYHAQVDPRTGAHLQPEYQSDWLVFPRGVEKKTYSLRSNYLKGAPLQFQQEENITGLPTYVFAYKGHAEYTEAYGGTADYPGVKTESGQDIHCADDYFFFKALVEPMTGEIIKIEESCVSGDYIYEIATGKQLAAVMRWGGSTAGDDVLKRVEWVQHERTRLLWLFSYAPLLLLAAGLLLLAFGMVPHKTPRI
jgi:hypothetical protein